MAEQPTREQAAQTTLAQERKSDRGVDNSKELLEANPALYGVDITDPNFQGPNGITYASIGPKMPKAAGEMENLIEDDRLVERKIGDDDAIMREGEGVVNIIAHKREGFQAKTAEEQIRSRGEKKGEELAKAEAPRKEEEKKRFEEAERKREAERKEQENHPHGGPPGQNKPQPK